MGNTRFRLAHVMPNVWFYKLRDIGRTRSQRKLLEARKTRVPESANALPRRSYYFGRAERGYALPHANRKASVVTPFPEQAKQRAEVGQQINESKRKNKGKKEKTSKCRSTTLIDSRISAGCSCRATVSSVWKTREVTDDNYWSNESLEDHEGQHIYYCSKQPEKKNYSRQSMEKLERTQLGPTKISSLRPQASKHVLQYGSNNVAGLPSPVQDEDDQDLRQHFDQPLGRTVKEMFDLVHDPFMVDTSSITCSSSCSWSISNSLTPEEQSDEEISEEVPFFNAKSPEFFNAKSPEFFNAKTPDPGSSLILEMKNKQRKFVQEIEPERIKPPSIRRRNAEAIPKITLPRKTQQHSEQISALKKADSRQPSSTSHMNFSTFKALDTKQDKPGRSRSRLSSKVQQHLKDSSPRLKGGLNKLKLDSQNASHSRLPKNTNYVEYPANSAKDVSFSDSFAVVKSSYEPGKDFRDSMVEMILENNIRNSTDLQKLLRCYLSLNSDEYHDTIIKVFEQVWSDLTDLNLRY